VVIVFTPFVVTDHTARPGSGYPPDHLCPRYESVTFL
jgi:hypothetical protein